jgi:hypothetical protein
VGRRDPLRLLSLPMYGRAATPMIAFPGSSHAITKFSGFMVSDIRLKDNELPEQAQLDWITKVLAEHAVIERRSVLGVIRDWDLPDHDEDIFAPDF